jgi:hypothetical protein
MADEWAGRGQSIDSPAANAAAVTPNNSTDLANATRALYIGGAGDVKVDLVGTGTAVIFAGLAAGTILPVRATRVYAADTDATSIVALW